MIQTLIPAYRPPINAQPLSSASVASREPNPTVIEPAEVLPNPARPDTKKTVPSQSDSPVYDDPRKPAKPTAQNTDEKNRELAEQLEIQNLSARDREVRAHERAHAAVGGQYASAPTYQYERGPDGVNYAVAGEVQISTGAVAGDPQATIEKAQVVRRAALAPAEPSAQDRQVAAQATKMEMDALAELTMLQQEERLETAAESTSEVSAGVNRSQVANAEALSSDNTVVTEDSDSSNIVQNLTSIGLENNRLSESLGQRIMSNDRLQTPTTGQLIDRMA